MPIHIFRWTDVSLAKLDEHGVTPEEFEAVVNAPERVEVSRSNPDRLIAYGHGDSGEIVVCVYEEDGPEVWPVTAYFPSPE